MNLLRIVCPIQHSPVETVALARALALARWHDAELHILHIGARGRVPSIHGPNGTAPLGRLFETAGAAMTDGVMIRHAVLEGDAVKATVEYTERNDADLVIVGRNSRPRGAFRSPDAFARALARAVGVPLISVPCTGPGQDAEPLFKSIVCAVDFSPASRHAVAQSLALAQQSAGQLVLLHVLEGSPHETVYSGSRAFQLVREYRARVDRVSSDLRALAPADALHWCDVDVKVVSGSPHEIILATAGERNADLIAVGQPRHAGLASVLFGSTVDAVMRRAGSPVLTVPGTNQSHASMDGLQIDMSKVGASGALPGYFDSPSHSGQRRTT